MEHRSGAADALKLTFVHSLRARSRVRYYFKENQENTITKMTEAEMQLPL